MRIELFDVHDADRLARALAVRFEVFVDEQMVPVAEELDEHDRDDPGAVHAIVLDGGRVVAAGRFYRLDDATVQVGRMAVRRAERGRGIGRALLEALLLEARRRGFTHVRLDAQVHAQEFYRKAGFEAVGPTHLDAGIAHQPMARTLP